MIKKIYLQVKRLPTEFTLASGFLVIILIGTILLLLPISHHGDISFIDALFTATSAVCVTGLTVLKIGSDFTFFGQIIILILIEVGGMGFMTFAVLGAELFRKRVSLKTQTIASYSTIQQDIAQNFRNLFKEIAIIVFIIEGIGTVFLFFAFYDGDLLSSFYFALFHSLSAFCNAGFSLYEDSLIGFSKNSLVVFPIMILIIIGGLGYPVLIEIVEKVRNKKMRFWSLHTKIVIFTSLLLITIGFVFLHFYENLSFTDSLFQSITARTAGFNTLEIRTLSTPSLCLLILLMFIGGSPASCAGGIKTSTFVIGLNYLWSNIVGEKRHHIGGYFIPGEISRKTITIMGLAVVWNFIGFFILLITENANLPNVFRLFFEQISAFGTVGLSTGITGSLSSFGKLWITITMFIGRIGPLTFVLLLFNKPTFDIKYPEGKVFIG